MIQNSFKKLIELVNLCMPSLSSLQSMTKAAINQRVPIANSWINYFKMKGDNDLANNLPVLSESVKK